jgi:energy-coupling factor transporter transmembrane protein EcfT
VQTRIWLYIKVLFYYSSAKPRGMYYMYWLDKTTESIYLGIPIGINIFICAFMTTYLPSLLEVNPLQLIEDWHPATVAVILLWLFFFYTLLRSLYLALGLWDATKNGKFDRGMPKKLNIKKNIAKN